MDEALRNAARIYWNLRELAVLMGRTREAGAKWEKNGIPYDHKHRILHLSDSEETRLREAIEKIQLAREAIRALPEREQGK